MVSPPVTTVPPSSIAEDSASAFVTTPVSTKPQSLAMLTGNGAVKDLTSPEVKRKKRSLFVSKSRAELTKRSKDRVADLQEKLEVPQKYVNQNVQRKMNIIKRKHALIQSLKRQLCQGPQEEEDQEVERSPQEADAIPQEEKKV